MTGTGYASADFTQWGTFPVGLLFFLMFVGGCAGSTTCGIKVFRFQILYEVTAAQVQQLIHPHGVFVPRYNTRPIERRIVTSVLSFFFLFGACFALLSILLSLLGLDFITAVSSAASALANVGPGLGDVVGPSSHFQSLPSAAKWLLAAGMLVGRLELFTVFVLLSPRFWRG
jgi:trk system potassium uptake protein TrkH